MEEVVGSIPTRSTIFTRLESITSTAFARIVQKSYNRPDSGDRKCSLFTRVITRPASTQISIIGAAAALGGLQGTLDEGGLDGGRRVIRPSAGVSFLGKGRIQCTRYCPSYRKVFPNFFSSTVVLTRDSHVALSPQSGVRCCKAWNEM